MSQRFPNKIKVAGVGNMDQREDLYKIEKDLTYIEKADFYHANKKKEIAQKEIDAAQAQENIEGLTVRTYERGFNDGRNTTLEQVDNVLAQWFGPLTKYRLAIQGMMVSAKATAATKG